MLRAKLNQAGDTIVEVLIATAVLAFAVGGAYALTTKSLQTSRNAQERLEALKIAETQLEFLKYQARTDLAFDGTYRVSGYCMKSATGVKGFGGDCAQGPDSRYTINITYTNDISPTPVKRLGTFNVRVTWDRLGGGQDELTINYQT